MMNWLGERAPLVVVKRLVAALAVAGIIVSACSPTGVPVEIVAHCGLAHPRIEFEGETWRFDVPADTDNNPPLGWSDRTIVTVERQGEEVVARGPLFSTYRLVPEDGKNQVDCL